MRGWNAEAKHLFGAWLARASPNLLRFVFLDGSARRFIVGWEDRARRLVAECRAELARQHDDPGTLALIVELRPGSPDFAIWWVELNVLDPEGGERRFFHPKDGPLAYEQVTFLPAAAPGFRVVLLLPRPVCAGPSGSGDVFGRRLGGALVSRNPWSHQIGRSHV